MMKGFSVVESLTKDQMFSLVLARKSCWSNSRVVGELRRYEDVLNYDSGIALINKVIRYRGDTATGPTSLTNNSFADIDGLVQDCSNSSALAMELLQTCIKSLISSSLFFQLLPLHINP